MITIEIPWEPVSWVPARISKYGTYDPREKDKRAVKYLVRQSYSGTPFECPVQIMFIFIWAPPKSATKKKREAMLKGEIIPTKYDATNCQKLYEDCLKGIVFKDDRQVEIIYSQKIYGEKAKTIMHIFARHEDYT